MTRLRDEIALIPTAMWVVSAAVYICLAAFLFLVAMRPMPDAIRILGSFGLPIIPASLMLLTGYVYGDAKRRNMRPVMWALLAFLVPNAIGFILYFILREPITDPCKECGKPVGRQFGYCPFCGARRDLSCPQCGSSTQPDWAHCPRCGTSLKR
jgi:hypothetical protein